METINLSQIKQLEASLGGISDDAQSAAKSIAILDDRLLTLRLSAGKLRAALERAFAPVTAAVAPMLEGAVRALTDFCDSAGAVMAALFGTVYKKSVTTAKAVGGAVRRTLASFDQLERLGSGSGGGSGGSTVTLQPINDPLTPQLQKIVDALRAAMDKVKSLIAPLKTIDFTPAADAFRRLGEAVSDFGSLLGEKLETVWHTLLVPLGKWLIETAAPASVDLLTAALTALSAVAQPVLAGLGSILEAVKPVAAFLGEVFTAAITGLTAQFGGLTHLLEENAHRIRGIFENLAHLLEGLWHSLEPVFTGIGELFSRLLETMGNTASGWISGLITAFSGLTGFLTGVFTGSWRMAVEGLGNILRGSVNGIISVINGLLSALTDGLNAVANAMNSFSFTVPDWVPKLGGKRYSMNLPTIAAPQIPYLAQGAVLPANKPFLAMVGDQRHGTNIEAPLATIQEAVALAMEDMATGNMAGHAATVDMLGKILEAVLGITIGDEVIAAAANRSTARMSVMKGAYHAG